jgi:hypothetical protein
MKQNRAARAGRVYPEGMRRMQAFYARHPQFRDVEFAVCGQEVVIFCQWDGDELREACELYDLSICIDAPSINTCEARSAEIAGPSRGPHDRALGRDRRNGRSRVRSRRRGRELLERDGLRADSSQPQQRLTSEG